MTHEQLAEEYYKLAKRGSEVDTDHPGLSWRAVIFFYAALQAVDHRLSTLKRKAKNHDERRTFVNNLPEFAAIKADYEALEGTSQQARYHPNSCPLSVTEFREARDRAKKIMKQMGFQT